MLNTRAPDFCAQAYRNGATDDVCLAAYRGRWLLILFYASDFSFV